MWYPEEPATYCQECRQEIPYDCFWRSRGFIIDGDGRQQRTPILYSQCPDCGRRLSVGLDGPHWHRWLYGWIWQLRYPRTRPPRMNVPGADRGARTQPESARQSRRRAVGE